MLPKKIWLLLNENKELIGISFDELPAHLPTLRRAIRYDCASRDLPASINGHEQLELFN